MAIFEGNYQILWFRRKKRCFRRFGSFGGLTEISAEIFRPRPTEISAEISVSVVHYIGRIFCRTFDESWLKAVQNTCWKKLLHWIELLCNDVICIKLGNETEKLGSHWTPSLCACFSTVRHFCTLWPKSVVNKTILFTISSMHEGAPPSSQFKPHSNARE